MQFQLSTQTKQKQEVVIAVKQSRLLSACTVVFWLKPETCMVGAYLSYVCLQKIWWASSIMNVRYTRQNTNGSIIR